MLDRLPKLRKFGLNTTGLTPHRGIPMLTKIVEMCHERDIIFSTRVSIDGVGDMHNEVRQVKRGFDKANETIRAMQALQKKYSFNFGISTTIFHMNLDDAENILAWATQREARHRLQHGAVHRADARQQRPRRQHARRSATKKSGCVSSSSIASGTDSVLDGQNYVYMHYADMIANGYHRLAPCPFQTQGIMLNPDGGVFFCENSDVIGNVRDTDPEALYFSAASQAHRDFIRDEKCPTCLSPCQMNVAAIKQVAPYAKFLVRAAVEKRRYQKDVVAAR